MLLRLTNNVLYLLTQKKSTNVRNADVIVNSKIYLVKETVQFLIHFTSDWPAFLILEALGRLD